MTILALRPALAALLAALLALAAPALADDKEARALRTTQDLLTAAHEALTGATDRAALRGAIEDAFAFAVWERFLIQNRADRFGEAERREFRELLPGFMAHLYHEQFDKGLDQPPAIGEVTPARGDVLVSATFKRANGRDLPVDWRLREVPEHGAQIIDVMVAGTSFLLLKRDEFTAIIDKGGPAALLQHMRENSL